MLIRYANSRPMKILLVIPVYDERPRLPDLLDRLPAGAEVLLVDDGSRDGSAALLAEWAAGRPGAEVLRLPVNRGKSAALAAALERVALRISTGDLESGDGVVLLDGDGQHPPEAAPALHSARAARGLDMLVACRDFDRYPFWKVLGNRILTWQARLLTGAPWLDTQCGMRALAAGRAAEAAGVLRAGRYCCEQELCVALPLRGWKVGNDFPIHTEHPRSNSTIRDAAAIFLAGLRAWARHRRSPSVGEPAPSCS